MYLQGDGVERNVTRAVEYLRRAAEANIVEAHSPLGACYLEGFDDTPPNFVLAKHHFKLGADGGDGASVDGERVWGRGGGVTAFVVMSACRVHRGRGNVIFRCSCFVPVQWCRRLTWAWRR